MRKIGSGLVSALVFGGYWVWNAVMHLLYRPRIVFAGENAKAALKAPCVLISNHKSHMDGAFLPLCLRRFSPSTFVARDWYDRKKFNWVFRRLPYLPMNRCDMDTEWLSLGEQALASGRSVLLFPEGKTSKTGEPDVFHPGFALLARRANVPVIPIALPGQYRRFRRTTVLIGEPIPPSEDGGRLSLLCRRDAETARERVTDLLFTRNVTSERMLADKEKIHNT